MNTHFQKDMRCTFELKDGTGADSGFYLIKGLASTFGNVDRVGDIVAKGAFIKSLMERMPKMLNQHNTDEVLGAWDKAYEIESGLVVEGRMPKGNTLVENIVPLIKMNAIDSMSIGFGTKISEYDNDTGIRTLKEVELWEVSIVTFPANEKAKIMSMKNANGQDKDEKMIDVSRAESVLTKKDFEDMLKETGCFTKKARVILAKHFKEEIQGEPDNDKRSESVVLKELLTQIENTKKGLSHGKSS